MSQFKLKNIEIYSIIDSIQAEMGIIIQSQKLINYINNLDLYSLDVKKVRIDAVKWFCSPNAISPEKLGFLFLEVECTNRETGEPVPGIVFLRGGAVAVYIVVEVEGKNYVVLTQQLRVPCGGKLLEIPAGMLDGSKNFAGVAMKEITEETGLRAPNLNELIPLGNPVIPSGGGCDEFIQLFFWKTSVDRENLEKMKSKIFGAPDENESIRLVFIPEEEYEWYLTTSIDDVKAISAHFRAKQMKHIM
jgi:ADP-sugar diphosphatase